MLTQIEIIKLCDNFKKSLLSDLNLFIEHDSQDLQAIGEVIEISLKCLANNFNNYLYEKNIMIIQQQSIEGDDSVLLELIAEHEKIKQRKQ